MIQNKDLKIYKQYIDESLLPEGVDKELKKINESIKTSHTYNLDFYFTHDNGD